MKYEVTTLSTGAAKIGRSGSKLHRAKMVHRLIQHEGQDTLEFDEVLVLCKCGCQGHKSAQGKIEYFQGAAPNCGT